MNYKLKITCLPWWENSQIKVIRGAQIEWDFAGFLELRENSAQNFGHTFRFVGRNIWKPAFVFFQIFHILSQLFDQRGKGRWPKMVNLEKLRKLGSDP